MKTPDNESRKTIRILLIAGGGLGFALLCTVIILTFTLFMSPSSRRSSNRESEATVAAAKMTEVAATGRKTVTEAQHTDVIDVIYHQATLTAWAAVTGIRGGYGGYVGSSVIAKEHPDGCEAHTVGIAFDWLSRFTHFDAAAPQASIRAAVTGENLAQGSLPPDNTRVAFDLPGLAGDQTVLVQVEHPQLAFENIIVHFPPDCSRNQVEIQYQPWSEDEAWAKNILAQPGAPTGEALSLDWHLLGWGASPFTQEWGAELSLQASGGDGAYLYWARGDVAGAKKGAPLSGDRLLVLREDCKPARFEFGVTSAGENTWRTYWLRPAICPPPAQTPTPVPTPTP